MCGLLVRRGCRCWGRVGVVSAWTGGWVTLWAPGRTVERVSGWVGVQVDGALAPGMVQARETPEIQSHPPTLSHAAAQQIVADSLGHVSVWEPIVPDTFQSVDTRNNFHRRSILDLYF